LHFLQILAKEKKKEKKLKHYQKNQDRFNFQKNQTKNEKTETKM
jgi:hypothetical protein